MICYSYCNITEPIFHCVSPPLVIHLRYYRPGKVVDGVPSPSLVFSFILATLFGSTFHFIAGGDARRLAILLLASWTGFALGQIVGELLGVDVANIGPLHLVAASIGALLALLLTWFFTRRRHEER